MLVGAAQGVDNLQLVPKLILALLHLVLDAHVVVGGKVELVNNVAKVVVVLTLEIRDEFVNVHAVAHEGCAVRELNVPNDLVDLDAARDTAALGGLRLHLLGPALLDALLDAVRVVEAPALADIGLADVLARVAAAVLGRRRAVARAAVVGVLALRRALHVALELPDLFGLDLVPVLAQTRLDNVVRQVALALAGDVHHVERQD